ncbi:MAG: response regulator [Bacteroidetes bacterium]|nr:response regulator [Bacteroidota bacterium]
MALSIRPRSVPVLKDIIFICIAGSVIGFIVSLFIRYALFLSLSLSLFLLLILSALLYRKRLLFLSAILTLFGISFCVTIVTAAGDGIHDPAIIFFPALLIFSAFVISGSAYFSAAFLMLALFNFGILFHWNSALHLPELRTENIFEIVFYNLSFIVLSVIGKLFSKSFGSSALNIPPKNNIDLFSRQKNITVAIVEDDKDNASLLKEIFTDSGYAAVSFDSASALEEWISTHGADLQLVITDFYLNMSDGRMVIENVRRIIPHIPIILISAYPLNELGVNIEFYKNVEFIAKPFTLQEIVSKAEQLLKGQSQS